MGAVGCVAGTMYMVMVNVQAKLDNGDNDFVFQEVVLLGRPGSRCQSDSFQQAGKLVAHRGGEDEDGYDDNRDDESINRIKQRW